MKIYELKNDEGKIVGYGFTCPGCLCDHMITTNDSNPKHNWTFNGDINRPTFSPSLLVYSQPKSDPPGPRCHSFIRDGKIQFLDDCEHGLKGQTIELPEL